MLIVFIVNNNPTNIDFLDVGNNCNFSCDKCYYGANKPSTKIDSTLEDEIIKKISSKYPQSKLFIYPPEITTSRYLLENIKEVGQKIVLTNGLGLNLEMVRLFSQAGIEFPKVTLFANPKEQEKWQGINKEQYLKIRKNIELAAREGLKVVVNSVLWKDNISSIESLVKQCYDLGVDRIKLIRFMEEENSDEFIKDEDMNEVIERVEKAKLIPSPRIQFSYAFAGPNFFGKSVEEVKRKLLPKEGEWVKSPYLCPAIGQNYWGVSLRKREVSWCYFLKDKPIGKIGILDNKGNIKINRNIDLQPETLERELKGKCSEDQCEYQKVCLGGCRRTAYLFANMQNKKDPLYSGMDTCLTKVYKRVFS